MLSNITVTDLHDSDANMTYESVSYQFGIGLIAFNSHNCYIIESSWKLSKELENRYIIAEYTDPCWKHHCRQLTNILHELSIKLLSKKYRRLIELYGVNSSRYTCIDTRDNSTYVFKFNHLDFLIGLANGHMNMGSIDNVNTLKVFDRYQLCDVNFKIIEAQYINDIIDMITSTLEYVLVLDLINIIKQYCTSIPTMLKLIDVKPITQKRYERSPYQYVHCEY